MPHSSGLVTRERAPAQRVAEQAGEGEGREQDQDREGVERHVADVEQRRAAVGTEAGHGPGAEGEGTEGADAPCAMRCLVRRVRAATGTMSPTMPSTGMANR